MSNTAVRFTMANRHIAEGERHIARQLALIDRHVALGLPTDEARRLLAVFRHTQTYRITRRDRIERELICSKSAVEVCLFAFDRAASSPPRSASALVIDALDVFLATTPADPELRLHSLHQLKSAYEAIGLDGWLAVDIADAIQRRIRLETQTSRSREAN